MPEIDELNAAINERLIPEVKAALKAAEAAPLPVRAWPPDWESTKRIDYFYRSGSLLTRDADAPRVARALQDIAAGPSAATQTRGAEVTADQGTSPIKGVTRFETPVSTSWHTYDAVAALEDRLGVGVVSHEHVFAITWVHCPATEPEPVLTPQQADDPELVNRVLWPPAGDPTAGHGVRVSVVDTGLLRGVAGWAPWLAGVTADSREDLEDPDTFNVDEHVSRPDGFADLYAGHGSFIAGVIRCVAPNTEVVVERLIGTSGFVSETDMIQQIHQGLSRSPDIINLSAGGYTRNDVPPIGLQALWNDRLSQQGGVVLVAAAGNNTSSRPFWPAAFDWCVGVGSMSRDGQRRSWFSNFGSWLDVYAPGEDIVNAYPQLKYKTVAHRRERDTSAGIVKWSGTSFATPIVVGLIAARMSRTGESGRLAAQAALSAARSQFRPGIGPRLFP
jgi:subtilisin family serine protease